MWSQAAFLFLEPNNSLVAQLILDKEVMGGEIQLADGSWQILDGERGMGYFRFRV
jgi:hypothetical protein